eukprot:7957092-Pyramimonas_sp.AAC.2
MQTTVDYVSPASWHCNYHFEGSNNIAGWTPEKVQTWDRAHHRWLEVENTRLANEQDSAGCDVFFIHTTTAMNGTGNATLDEGEDITRASIRSMASAFNGSCRVFAPKYRQARSMSYLVCSELGESFGSRFPLERP